MHKLSFLIIAFNVFISCQSQKDSRLQKIATLPSTLDEISGINYTDKTKTLYAINDSGNANTLFQLNLEGELVHQNTLPISITNVDWEDLAYDHNGNIFIGDFGNNDNKRKDLVIYKVNSSDTSKISATHFSLEDQKDFPPKKSKRNFDIEAFIYHNDYFYLFTKNRSSKFNGITKLYKLPAKEGSFKAKLLTTYSIGNDSRDCFITAAAINTNGDKIALLTYNKIYLLSNFEGDHLFDGDVQKIKLKHFSQKEGITFIDDNTLYISNETSKGSAASLYQYSLN